jgi:signal transduction histidine kinase
MVGYTHDEFLELRLEDLVEPGELQQKPIQYDQLRAGDSVLRERTLRRKDGTTLAVEVNARMLPSGDILTIARDIGPRRIAEAALRAQEVAERANRSMNEFVSRISHELRTPMNAILGFSEMLTVPGADPLTATQREQVQHVRNAGRHLLALIDDLLDLSSIEAGKLRLRAERVDLSAALGLARDDLRRGAEALGVHVAVEVPRGSTCHVCGDATRLRQVLVNILSNAVKYNRPGGTVTVACDADGPWVRLTVTDDGIGMTPEQMEGLFQPFNRLGREHSDIAGSGIGLAVARGLVEMMGGRISVRSAPQRGSTFVVEMPVAPEDAASGHGRASDPMPRRREDIHGHVLYVEDDEVNRLLVQAYCTLRPGIELELAVDGQQGLAAAAARPPDLILADMSLPDMHGLDLLRELRAHAALRHVPCVGISANAMRDQTVAAEQAGLDAYLTKPVSAADLLQTLDRFLA